MEPINYVLPLTDKILEINPSEFKYDSNPSPKLIKYGFNNITEKLDLETITSIPQYRAGLNFDFESTDKNSIAIKLATLFKIKNIDPTLAEFWEILTIFGLLKTNQNIYTSNPKTVNDIINVYQSLTKTKNTYDVTDKAIKKASLIIFKYGDSDVDIDESVGIQLLTNNLGELLAMQAKGASMILQLFGLQTQISAEFIYYLSTLYNEAYLTKPIIASDLSNSRYIVLKGLKDVPPKNISFTMSSKKKNTMYLTSIGLNHIPIDVDTVIQCMNATIIPLRYKKYNQIKDFLNTKVYEGITYQTMIQQQYQNAQKWVDLFGNLSEIEKIFDQSLKKTMGTCGNYAQLYELLK